MNIENDFQKAARIRAETAIINEALVLIKTKFHLSAVESERKAASMLLARLLDPYVKAGIDDLSEAAVQLYYDYTQEHPRTGCSHCKTV